MKSHQRHRSALAVTAVLALSLGLSACGVGSDPQVSESTSASPSPSGSGYQNGPVEPDPEDSSPPSTASTATTAATPSSGTPETDMPEVKAVDDKAITEAATKYVTARENRVSHTRQKPSDWLKEAKPYMTDDLYKEVAGQTSDEGSPGAEWNVAHDQKIGVKVEVSECGVNVASGVDTDKKKFIQCAVTDIVVDADGKAVPTTKIPLNWTYVGSQSPAMLEMVKVGEKWLVSQDATGMAS